MEKLTVKMVDVNTRKTVIDTVVNVETSHNGYPLPDAVIDRDAVNAAVIAHFGERAVFDVDHYRTNGGTRLFGWVMRIWPKRHYSSSSISDLVYADVYRHG